mgnify:FL=1
MSRRSRFSRAVGFENNRPHLAGRWRTIWDLNLKGNDISTTGALTENAGALTTLEGLEYHLRVGDTDQSWTVTANTGLVTVFQSASSAESRLDLKIPHVPRLADGGFPRLRVSVAFSGLVVNHNADYVAAGIGSWWRNHAAAPNPGAWTTYDAVAAATPTFQWICRTSLGDLGDAAPSGTRSSSGVGDPNDADNGVMVIEDAGQGVWNSRGHSGNTNIIIGSSAQDTYQAQNSTQGYSAYTDSQKSIFWRSNATYDGPYVTMRTKSGNTGGGQTITWERVIVEAFL